MRNREEIHDRPKRHLPGRRQFTACHLLRKEPFDDAMYFTSDSAGEVNAQMKGGYKITAFRVQHNITCGYFWQKIKISRNRKQIR